MGTTTLAPSGGEPDNNEHFDPAHGCGDGGEDHEGSQRTEDDLAAPDAVCKRSPHKRHHAIGDEVRGDGSPDGTRGAAEGVGEGWNQRRDHERLEAPASVSPPSKRTVTSPRR